MAVKGFTRRFKPLEILTGEQVEAIHRGTLDVLQETGVRIKHEKALNLFKENGCEVNFDKNRVKFPPGLVEECIRKTPSSFRVKARNSKDDVIVGGDTTYFWNFPGKDLLDLDTWETRVPTRKENYEGVKVIDALDNFHLICAYTPYFGFKDVPECMKIPESCAAKFRNSTKTQLSATQKDSEVFTIKMAKAIGVDLMLCSYASPPLTVYEDQVEAAFRAIEAGFPILTMSDPIMGGTGPATIAGSTLTNNAEMLAVIVLAQLIKSGAKVIANVASFPQDMIRGVPAFGAIGIPLQATAGTQIYRKYGIPTQWGSSGVTSSKRIDFQCGYEKVITSFPGVLAGSNIISHHGGIYGELAFHPVQAILDDDIAGMMGRFIEGVGVDDETLAIDLINEVGPIPGQYLDKAHTRKWWKKEQFIPKVADRLTYPEWKESGKRSAIDYAKERMDEILETHKPKPLTDNEEDAIENILNEARDYYRDKAMISKDEWGVYKKQIEFPSYPYE